MLFILAGDHATALWWSDQMELVSREVLFVSPSDCAQILRGVKGGKYIVHESWFDGPYNGCRRDIIAALRVCRVLPDVERQAILDLDERERRRYREQLQRDLVVATRGETE